jgi:hypothetical protein
MVGGPTAEKLPDPCRLLLDYWYEQRGSEPLPRRGQIDPARLQPILPFITISELVSRQIVRVRLAGTGMRDLLGFELTGRNYLDLTPPAQRRTRSWRIWSAACQPCGSRYSGTLLYSTQASETYHGISLPVLSDQPDQPMQAISVLLVAAGRRWYGQSSDPAIGLSEDFGFIDVGYGVPGSIDPPHDWLMA